MNVKTNHSIQCTVALALLQEVIDPELGLNVVDLGLIYELNFYDEEKKLDVLMTLSTRFCPMGQSIQDSVKTQLENNFPGYTVNVQLTFDPPWSYEKISIEGRDFLNA
jgi:metal-sulfur cluster biosynthetic enzyme